MYVRVLLCLCSLSRGLYTVCICMVVCFFKREKERVDDWSCCFANEHVSRVESNMIKALNATDLTSKFITTLSFLVYRILSIIRLPIFSFCLSPNLPFIGNLKLWSLVHSTSYSYLHKWFLKLACAFAVIKLTCSIVMVMMFGKLRDSLITNNMMIYSTYKKICVSAI